MAAPYLKVTGPVLTHAPPHPKPNLAQIIAQWQAEIGLTATGPNAPVAPRANEAWTHLIVTMGHGVPHSLRRARDGAAAIRRLR